MKRIVTILPLLLLMFLAACTQSSEYAPLEEPALQSEHTDQADSVPYKPADIDEHTKEDEQLQEPIDPDTVVSITYDESYPTAEAIEPFWEDESYIYSFPSIRSQYITVTYGDGSTQTIREALQEGKASIEDLYLFDVHYYKEERIYFIQNNISLEHCTVSAEDSEILYPILRDADWTEAETTCDPDVTFSNSMGTWSYHTECGTIFDVVTGMTGMLSEENRQTVNDIIELYLGSSLFHSELYLPDVTVDDVLLWYNEVVLDAEFENGGDASLVQKWTQPIICSIAGEPTDIDLAILNRFLYELNEMEGFPGISIAENGEYANLRIHFCSNEEELINIMGSQYANNDGAVTFWYDYNQIYDADICIRSDIDQNIRNSVIQEELYNGLGPVQDTQLREDSLIWYGYSIPQDLTDIDWLILKLLYHPDILCGMNAAECEEIIRNLYY